MATLYRKYRPQTFSQVAGQNHIKTTLQNEIKTNKYAQSYLFCGPRGTGKTTMARLVAKALNCKQRTDGEFEPCNTCEICTDIMAGNSLDIVEIDAASNTGVDNVRENIIQNTRFAPSTSKFKVFIIDEVHMLSVSAFNALLKILEEPPSYVLFILATTEIHKILPTIISRCQRFDFKKIPHENLVGKLHEIATEERITADDAVYNHISVQSQGCLRDALSLFEQIMSIGESHITHEHASFILPMTDYALVEQFVSSLSQRNSADAIKFLYDVVEQGGSLTHFSQVLVEYLRKMLLLKVDAPISSIELTDQNKETMKSLADTFTTQQLVYIIDIFVKALAELKNTIIAQLPLEIGVIQAIEALNGVRTEIPQSQSKNVVQPTSSVSVQPQSKPVKPVLAEPVQAVESVNTVSHSSTREQDDEQTADESQPRQSLTEEQRSNLDVLWSSIRSELQKKNYSLSCLISTAQLHAIDDSSLTIALKHTFHIEKLQEPKNREVIVTICEGLLGKKIEIKTIIDKSIEAVKSSNSISISEARTYKSPEHAEDDSVEPAAPIEEQKTAVPDESVNAALDIFGGNVVG